MRILQTDRLVLCTWCEADTPHFIAMNQDPVVMRYFPKLATQEETRALIDAINQSYQAKGFTLYAIELKATGAFMGFCGLMTPSFEAHFTPAVEIGWRLASQHWGHGYATEAARAVLHHALMTLNLDEVVSFTSVINKPSIRVMEKIALQHDPADDFDHPRLAKDDPLCRHVVYRLTKVVYQASLID